jgi:hypothetical protein
VEPDGFGVCQFGPPPSCQNGPSALNSGEDGIRGGAISSPSHERAPSCQTFKKAKRPFLGSKKSSSKTAKTPFLLSEICSPRCEANKGTVLNCAANISIETAYTAPSSVTSVHAWHSRQKSEHHHARRPPHQARHLSLSSSSLNPPDLEATFDSLLSYPTILSFLETCGLSLLLRSSFLAADHYQDAALYHRLPKSNYPLLSPLPVACHGLSQQNQLASSTPPSTEAASWSSLPPVLASIQ